MKEICPVCDSSKGMREIIYGLPEFPVDDAKFHIGGCCVETNSPTWHCINCGWEDTKD